MLPGFHPHKPKSAVLLLLSSALLLTLGGCDPSPKSEQSGSATPQPLTSSPSSSTFMGAASPNGASAASGASGAEPEAIATPAAQLVEVTIYKADDQCVNFVPQQVQVAGDRPMEAAVGKVLENQGGDEFDLSGYRVSVDAATGTATVDLRMKPDSQRQIVSLSACEQFSLFGSLQETLTKNPDWNVKTVRFTERGSDLAL